MDCDRAQDFIMEHAEERLAPLSAVKLHGHLSSCAPCRELFVAMTDTTSPSPVLFAAHSPRGDFTDAVMAKIDAPPPQSLLSYRAKKYLRRAACLYSLLLSVVFVLVYNPVAAAMDAVQLGRPGLVGRLMDAVNLVLGGFFAQLAELGYSLTGAFNYFAGTYSFAVLIITALMSVLAAVVSGREDNKT